MNKKDKELNLCENANLYKLDYLPRCILRNLKGYFRKIHWARERAKYGISRYDAWDFDYYLFTVIENGIKFLKEAGNSHPCYCTYEEWQTKLQYIIKLAELCNLDSGETTMNSWERYLKISEEQGKDSEECIKARDTWLADEYAFEELKENTRKKVFKELSKYSGDLWD